ncbi:MAG: AAA family ATPase, partial [Oscillospiraceae bacterium]|nr:AAA family ATPase [Oscillospiraceae bacterium]
MGFFDKIFSGLSKTRSNLEELEELFQGYAPDDEDFYDELEELLVLSDVGAATAERVVYLMRRKTWEDRFRRGDEARRGLIQVLTGLLDAGDTALKLNTRPSVVLMVGVNGVGKTTTIGKLAAQLKAQGKSVLLVAGDTFRAAAAEQLGIWAQRAGTDLVRHEEGSDPASVVYDGICAAKARGADVIIIDTAGRLHNKQNLMNEL